MHNKTRPKKTKRKYKEQQKLQLVITYTMYNY